MKTKMSVLFRTVAAFALVLVCMIKAVWLAIKNAFIGGRLIARYGKPFAFATVFLVAVECFGQLTNDPTALTTGLTTPVQNALAFIISVLSILTILGWVFAILHKKRGG